MMKKFGMAMTVAITVAIVLGLAPRAHATSMDACTDADAAIQAYGADMSYAMSAATAGQNLLDEQLMNGTVKVGSDAYDNAVYQINSLHDEAAYDASVIDYEVAVKSSLGCPF